MQVKRLSLVTKIERMPTGLLTGKAMVGVREGECAGESAGVRERGMLGKGLMEELGKPMEVSRQ